MKDALIVSVLSVVPKNSAARGMGHLARLRLPAWLHRLIVTGFVRKYRVDLSECEGGVDDFPTLADFFVRALKPGMRPIDPRPEVLCSPVDAVVHTVGSIQGGAYGQADGVYASVAELLGRDEAPEYEGGSFAILYLSPRDYHRVHTPCAGRVRRLRYLPGQLWPVFPVATRRVEGLFGRNERLVFEIESEVGTVVEAMIGAFGVGRMSTTIHPLVTNQSGAAQDLELDVPIERCAELGRFELGSTVILVLPPGRVEWTIKPGEAVRLGRPIARVLAGADGGATS